MNAESRVSGLVEREIARLIYRSRDLLEPLMLHKGRINPQDQHKRPCRSRVVPDLLKLATVVLEKQPRNVYAISASNARNRSAQHSLSLDRPVSPLLDSWAFDLKILSLTIVAARALTVKNGG